MLEKKYIIDNKNLMEQWDYEKNKKNNIFPENITIGNSTIKIWWKCEKGHSYQQIVRSKVRGIGCPICSNKLVLKGYNDLATTNPELLDEWDYEKNKLNGITPYNITKGAEKKVWWICNKCKMSYECFAYSKAKNVGCPYCSGKSFKKGLNDIFTIHSNWKNYWDFELNEKDGINPYKIGSNSHIKANWICSNCGVKFRRALSKTKDIILCNNCSIKKGTETKITTILSKNGSLLDHNPLIAEEWDYAKNGDLTPNKVTNNSNQKVWWICPNGHSYKITISHKSQGRGCPKCSKEMSISFPEKAIFYYLKQVDDNIIESYNPSFLMGKEIDIYLPAKKLGIEYDGKMWHTDIQRDLEKNQICYNNGINLIRIREEGCPKLNDSSQDFYYKANSNYENLNNIIYKIINEIYNKKIEVNIQRDRIDIYKLVTLTIKEKSLENMYPTIAKEWDYKLNKGLKPSQFYANSSRKVWWICPNGHSYESTISHRVVDKNNCPFCSNQKILKGYNDLATTNPEMLKEWNYEKNNILNLFPDNVFKGSHKKVWWKCEKNHEWQASISNRVRGRKCPICSNRLVVKGINDLKTTHSQILEMWNYKRNEELGFNPEKLSFGSDKKVWWICPKCKNEWQQRISHISNGIGCPNCHYNSLKSQEENNE